MLNKYVKSIVFRPVLLFNHHGIIIQNKDSLDQTSLASSNTCAKITKLTYLKQVTPFLSRENTYNVSVEEAPIKCIKGFAYHQLIPPKLCTPSMTQPLPTLPETL